MTDNYHPDNHGSGTSWLTYENAETVATMMARTAIVIGAGGKVSFGDSAVASGQICRSSLPVFEDKTA